MSRVGRLFGGAPSLIPSSQEDLTPHSWSPAQLRDLYVAVAVLEERVLGLDRLTNEKFVKLDTLMVRDAERTALALAAVDKANAEKALAADKRFDLLNELRTGVATRDQLDALEKLLSDLKERFDKLEAHRAGTASTWGLFTGAITLVVIVVNVIFYVIR